MSQYKDIPLPQDQRNVSQNDILTNFRYLSTPINVAAGTPNGIIPVDHISTGDNVGQPTCGFHKQVSMLNIATPANLTNATNAQNSNTITYSKADGDGNGQLRMLNAVIDQPVTYLKAMCQFDAAGNPIGNNFNVNSVTVIAGPAGYRVRFVVDPLATNYAVFISSISNTGATMYAYSYSNKLVGRFDVYIYDVIAKAFAAPSETSVMVYGLF